jgi:hypothetical protein
LDEDEAILLTQLSSENQSTNGDPLAMQLGAYDFELITSPHSPLELKVLVQRLRRMQWPALISDGLGFVHAVNSAMLNLFGIEPNSLILRRWESWHTLAAMLTQPSPMLSAHANLDNYFPPLVYDFFQSTAPYLFTPQMRALLRELHYLSNVSGLNFSKWWYAASSFTLFFKQSPSTCILRHGNRFHTTAIFKRECHWVHMAATMSAPYYLGIWQPLGAETQALFEHLTGVAAPGEIFFAADFDLHHGYHVNCWPEVAQLLQLAE